MIIIIINNNDDNDNMVTKQNYNDRNYYSKHAFKSNQHYYYYHYYYYYFLEIPVTFELKGMDPSQGAVEKFFHRLEVVAFEVLPWTSWVGFVDQKLQHGLNQVQLEWHTVGWMGGWMGGWMDGWVDGWMDGWMDGWVDGGEDRWMISTCYNYFCKVIFILYIYN